jgi:hypothetical protein
LTDSFNGKQQPIPTYWNSPNPTYDCAPIPDAPVGWTPWLPPISPVHVSQDATDRYAQVVAPPIEWNKILRTRDDPSVNCVGRVLLPAQKYEALVMERDAFRAGLDSLVADYDKKCTLLDEMAAKMQPLLEKMQWYRSMYEESQRILSGEEVCPGCAYEMTELQNKVAELEAHYANLVTSSESRIAMYALAAHDMQAHVIAEIKKRMADEKSKGEWFMNGGQA